jgi:hypothetical protein
VAATANRFRHPARPAGCLRPEALQASDGAVPKCI